MNLTSSVLLAIAGIFTFIYSVKSLSNSLNAISGNKFKKIIFYLSKNSFFGVLLGFVITTFIQSSDASVAIIIGLISGRFISLKIAIAFLLGANIGTSTTSLIYSFSNNNYFSTDWLFILIFIGVLGMSAFKKNKNRVEIFKLIFAIGLIFLALKILGIGAKVISTNLVFKNFVSQISAQPWYSYLFSIFFTGLLQSSSATTILYQIIYLNDPSVKLAATLALVLGANVGTTFTGLIVAFFNSDKNSKRIAFIWGLTNLLTSFVLMFFINEYAKLINLIYPVHRSSLSIAIGHILFNVILVTVFFPLIGLLEKISKKVIPEKEIHSYNFALPQVLFLTPDLALESASKNIKQTIKIIVKAMISTKNYLLTFDKKNLNKIQEIHLIIKEVAEKMNDFLIQLGSKPLNNKQIEKQISFVLSIRAIKKISEINLVIQEEILAQKKSVLKSKKEILTEIKEINFQSCKLLELVSSQITDFSKNTSKNIKNFKYNIEILINRFKKNEIYREIANKNYQEISEILKNFQNLISMCEKIDGYILNSKRKSTLKLKKLPENFYFDV